MHPAAVEHHAAQEALAAARAAHEAAKERARRAREARDAAVLEELRRDDVKASLLGPQRFGVSAQTIYNIARGAER